MKHQGCTSCIQNTQRLMDAMAGWHAQAARRRKSRANFVAYVSSRAVVILFYVGAALLLSASGSRYSALHVHHL